MQAKRDTSGDEKAKRGNRIRHMALRSPRCREAGNFRVGQAILIEQRFLLPRVRR